MRAGPSGPRRAGWREAPHPSRLDPGHPRREQVLDRHRRAVAAGLSAYVDPASGYTVLTAAYLAERGYCCDNGCRHCPWTGADAHPEDPDGPDITGPDGTGPA